MTRMRKIIDAGRRIKERRSNSDCRNNFKAKKFFDTRVMNVCVRCHVPEDSWLLTRSYLIGSEISLTTLSTPQPKLSLTLTLST